MRGSHGTQISIHAPVKGATFDRITKRVTITISIHAPVKGATYIPSDQTNFSMISIHAPVKGATMANMVAASYITFQSTLP